MDRVLAAKAVKQNQGYGPSTCCKGSKATESNRQVNCHQVIPVRKN